MKSQLFLLFNILIFTVSAVCQHQITIDSIPGADAIEIVHARKGIEIKSTSGNAIRIDKTDQSGIVILDADDYALDVGYAGEGVIRVDACGGTGIIIDDAQGQGISIGDVAKNGLRIQNTEEEGIWIDDIAKNGIYVKQAIMSGLKVDYVDEDGIQINSAGHDGVNIDSAARDGIYVKNAKRFGFHVTSATNHGLYVESSQKSGIQVNAVADNGVEINSANYDGVNVNMAGRDGVYINEAGRHGFYIFDAIGDGLKVDNSEGYSLNVQGTKNLSAGLIGHIAQLYNKSPGSSPDVLALKVGSPNPNTGSNFITFYDGNDTALGRIEGNGSGSIQLLAPGGDYAELLPKIDPNQDFSAGDIVGVFGGHISYQTTGADRVMVITDQAIVVGNQPKISGEIFEEYEQVSFIGQVPTQVMGPVESGDWIVASGRSDGTGMALTASELTLDHQILGQAWESSSDPGVKRVNTVVGLDHDGFNQAILQKVYQELENQKRINENLQLQIDELKQLLEKRLPE